MAKFFVVNLSLVDYFPRLIFFHVQFCHVQNSMVDFGSIGALCMVPCDLSCYLLLIATLEITFNYFKMLWFTRAPLHYVIIDNLWHCKAMFHFQKVGQLMKLWWKYCHQLCIGVFWIKAIDIGSLRTLCNFT
jgi:hypothetical protein